MKAHKRNPFRGEGLDKRQARRLRRRLARHYREGGPVTLTTMMKPFLRRNA